MSPFIPPKHIQLNIIRKAAVCERMSFSNSLLHVKIDNGLIPPSFSLGCRAVGFLDHEINEVIAAMASGKSNDEIKELVKVLVAQRQELMGDMM